MDEKTKNSILKAKNFKDIIKQKDSAPLTDLSKYADCLEATLSAYTDFSSLCSKILPEGSNVLPGNDIILCGKIGLAGTIFLLDYFTSGLLKTLSPSYIKESESLRDSSAIYPDVALLKELGVSGIFPVCERGLFKSIYELGKSSGLGFRIDYSKVPISQYTIEFCEIFDIDPWGLLSGGCVLITANKGLATVSKLNDAGFDAAAIGYITKDKAKLQR